MKIAILICFLALTASGQIPQRVMQDMKRAAGSTLLPNVTSGLTNWWKFDEGTDAYAYDSGVGTVDYLWVQAGKSWTNDSIIGPYAIWCSPTNSSNPLVPVAGKTSVNYTNQDFSIAFWFKRLSLFTDENVFCTGPYEQYGYYAELATSGGIPSFYWVFNQSGAHQAVTIVGLTTNVWTHICCVRQSTNAIIYTNSVVGASITNVINPLPAQFDLVVGAYFTFHAVYSHYLTNTILDDFRIYNRALSSSEVQTIYNWRP